MCPTCGSQLLREISRLPKESYTFALEKLNPYPWIQQTIYKAQEVVARPQPNWWFTMEGATGVGKTAIMYSMANALLARGFQVLYYRTFEAMQYIKSGFSDNTAQSKVDELQDVRVLMFDEIGYQLSEYDAKVLADIMGYRYARGAELLTVMAYNPPHSLPPLVASRMLDARSYFVRLQGQDLRPFIGRGV